MSQTEHVSSVMASAHQEIFDKKKKEKSDLSNTVALIWVHEGKRKREGGVETCEKGVEKA